MRISAEGKIGIGLGLVGLGGAGAVMVWPEHTWIGWVLMVVAAVGGVALSIHHFGERWNTGIKIAAFFSGVFVIAIVGWTAWFFWPVTLARNASPNIQRRLDGI